MDLVPCSFSGIMIVTQLLCFQSQIPLSTLNVPSHNRFCLHTSLFKGLWTYPKGNLDDDFRSHFQTCHFEFSNPFLDGPLVFDLLKMSSVILFFVISKQVKLPYFKTKNNDNKKQQQRQQVNQCVPKFFLGVFLLLIFHPRFVGQFYFEIVLTVFRRSMCLFYHLILWGSGVNGHLCNFLLIFDLIFGISSGLSVSFKTFLIHLWVSSFLVKVWSSFKIVYK